MAPAAPIASVDAEARADLRPPNAPDTPSLPIRSWLLWMSRGSWALADQGLFAISNFVLNLLLARWLAPVEFGAYASAYAVFLLLATAHTSFVTEPMLVHGTGKYKDNFPQYVRLVMRGHWLVSSGIAGVLMLIGAGLWLAVDGFTGSLFVVLGLCAPFILLPWAVRRAFFARLRPRSAALGGGLYLLIVLVQILALKRYAGLSAVGALVAMAVAAFVTGLCLLRSIGGPTGPPAHSASVYRDHWNYGRWSLVIAALLWVPGNLPYLVIPIWGGLEGSGLFKALMNLAMPMFQSTSALSNLLVPGFATIRNDRGREALRRGVWLALAALVSISLAYSLSLALVGRTLMEWVYGGRYEASAFHLVLAGLLPLGGGLVVLAGTVLRSMDRVRVALSGAVVAAVLMLTMGTILIFVDGVRGGFVGYLLSTLCASIVMARSCRKALHELG